MMKENSKDYKPHDQANEFQPVTDDEKPRYGIDPEQASVNLKKKRKRIQRK